MSPPRLPVEVPAEIRAITTDLPASILGDSFRVAGERFDGYIGAIAAELVVALDLPAETLLHPDRLVAERGWAPAGAVALRWLFETLTTYGAAETEGGNWRLRPTGAAAPSAAALSAAAIAAFPETAPSYRIYDLSAAALAPILRGEMSGEEALFSPSTLGLWFDYFSNANPLYSLNNALAATALSRAVGPEAHLLEVGGGGGSAAQAALGALAEAGIPPAEFVFTELHPAFLRRGGRVARAAAPAGCTVTVMRYDIDGEPSAQGLGDRRFDAVLAVNALHLARDLVASLARLRSLLRPGGVLVFGELLRREPLAGVHLELPFTLLESYRAAPLVEGLRERPGFLAPDGWRRALAAAGFSRVELLPEHFARCAELYAGFCCGAVTAFNGERE